VIARRFVFDAQLGAVVELLGSRKSTVAAGDLYEGANADFKSSPDEATGARMREAALERADRRVWAHKRLGNEHRWRE